MAPPHHFLVHLLSPKVNTILTFITIDFAILELHINGIPRIDPCVYVLLLHMTFVRFIHVVARK